MGFVKKNFWLSFLIIFLIGSLWDNYAPAKDIKVMTIDTGLDASHPYLQPYITPIVSEDYIDTHGHGTFVAGILAATGCKRLKIIPCKLDNYVLCLVRAYKENVDIVNFSGGGIEYDPFEDNAIRALNNKGIPVVVAAGNDHRFLGSPCWGYFPACSGQPNVIPVGALGRDEEHLRSSNYGKPDMVWRIGEDIRSTYLNHGWATMSGTSMATALYTHYLIKQMCKDE